MRLDYDDYSTRGGIHQHISQSSLCQRMKVNLGLFQIHQLTWARHEQSDDYRQGLRYTETDVGDTDQVARTAPGSMR